MKRTNMKRWLCLVLSLVMVLAVVPGAAYADTPEDVVVINETNFPDDVFRAYVSEYFDNNSDGALSDAEISSITDISVGNKGIRTLKGLEHFTSLSYLLCWDNQLTELDVSANTALKYLVCSENKLTSLDVSNNTLLITLNCSDNLLTSLDVSNNTLMEGLYCDSNQLSELDVSKNAVLKKIWCYSNQLTTLDFSFNTELTDLVCHQNQLTELNISNCYELGDLQCGYNQLNTLDVSINTKLWRLECSGNTLTTLNVYSNTGLIYLGCGNNQLETLDLSNNNALKSLTCFHNPMEQLDIHACAELLDAYINGDVYVPDADTTVISYQIIVGGSLEKSLWIDKTTEILPDISRIAGKNRFKTAIDAADQLKEELDFETFPNIVIASGTDFPDALAGAYLAIEKDAPVLLTNAGFAPTVAEYAKDNLAEGGTVYILGGKGAVPEVMETELEKVGITSVKRLAGANRYATNIEILKEAGVTGRNLLICSGTGYADSLSASALGRPILLVGNSLTDEQKEFLTEVKEDMSADFFVLGGTAAVSEDVYNEVKEYAKGTTERVSGKNRFLTSVAIAERFLPADTESVVLAYAMNYPDGLAGGPIAYATHSPLLLVTDASYSDAVTYANQAGVEKVIIMGGKSLIPDDVALAMVI